MFARGKFCPSAKHGAKSGPSHVRPRHLPARIGTSEPQPRGSGTWNLPLYVLASEWLGGFSLLPTIPKDIGMERDGKDFIYFSKPDDV